MASRWRVLGKGALFVLGLAMVISAVVFTWSGRDGGGAVVAFVVAGVLLLVLPFVVDRMLGLAIGMDGFEIRLSEEIRKDAPEAARILGRTELDALAEDRNEVNHLFRNGAPMVRMLALGLMQGDNSLIDAGSLVSAIERPRTSNEQFHGLALVERIWPRLPEADRKAVLDAVDAADLREGSDREAIACRLRKLAVHA
jgi:hypothetical protein